MKNSRTKMIVEGAMLLALAIVLSLITPFQKLLPFGGSITLLSMLPICIFSIKYGVGKGLGVSFLFAVFQFAQGTIKDGLFGWGLTAGMLIACIVLDYFLSYTVIGLAGFARKKGLAGLTEDRNGRRADAALSLPFPQRRVCLCLDRQDLGQSRFRRGEQVSLQPDV